MGLLDWLLPPSIFNVSQTRLLDKEQGAQLEPEFRPALLVVDMQEDFCPPNGSLAVAGGRSITPLINTLLTSPLFVLRVATKDWHPPHHISFASNHQHLSSPSSSSSSSEPPSCCPSPPTDALPFVSTTTIHNPHNPSESYTTRLWPPHCITDTPGSSLIPELDVSKIDKILEKGTDPRVEMYSAFYDPFTCPRVSDSGLAEMLRQAKVTHVYVVGLAADYCVWSTAMDAHKEGFETVIVEEATRAVDEEGWRACKSALEEAAAAAEGKGVKVVRWEGEEVGRLFPGGLGEMKTAAEAGFDGIDEKEVVEEKI